MECSNITLDQLHNADQTGLFFNKLSNHIYIDKEAKDYHGVKQMKKKDHSTLMVASSASGKKCDTANALSQSGAWFDRDVTVHWINTNLWPWHVEQHGNVHCLLLLDNCIAHTSLGVLSAACPRG